MKSNLPPEYRQMNKFTDGASGEREKKIHATNNTFCQNDKSYEVSKTNLPPEHQQMHKFTEVASGEREKQNSCYLPHFLSERKK